MITYIRAIRSAFLGVVPVSSIGYVVGVAGLGAVAVKVRVRSLVEAISPIIVLTCFSESILYCTF
jgi:hypothetical protein